MTVFFAFVVLLFVERVVVSLTGLCLICWSVGSGASSSVVSYWWTCGSGSPMTSSEVPSVSISCHLFSIRQTCSACPFSFLLSLSVNAWRSFPERFPWCFDDMRMILEFGRVALSSWSVRTRCLVLLAVLFE